MRFARNILGAVLVAAILLPPAARGAGYNIYEQGAAALGMGGAHTASVHDASALFYNPAAIVWLGKCEVQAGTTWLRTSTSFAGVDPNPGFGVAEAMKDGTFFPSTFYLAHRVSPSWFAGLAFNDPFGLGIEWENPESFTGRTIVTKADLRTYNLGGSIAWKMNEHWSIGAGPDYLLASVELNRINTALIPGGGGASANVARVKLKGDPTGGFGYHVAISGVPSTHWKLGVNYRSLVTVEVDDGDATFTQMLTGDGAFDAAVAAGLPPNQKVATTLKFPALLSGGLAWVPNERWTWEVNLNYMMWSAFEDLPLDFKTTNSLDTRVVEEYDDQFQVRVGAEHRLPGFTYRFGYYYDQAAAPTESVSPLLPDANRHGATFGLGWKLGEKQQWTLDLYDLALFVENRSTEGIERDQYNGTYKSFVNAAGLSVGRHW